jgi:hypothetical protein
VRADADALLAGEESSQTADLVAGDPSRWARLQVIKRARDLQREKLGEVRRRAGVAAEREMRAVRTEVEEAALEGWQGRANKGLAWQCRYVADKAVGRWSWLHSVGRWSGGGRWEPGHATMPDGKAGGALVALRQHLDGQQGVTFSPSLIYPHDYLSGTSDQEAPKLDQYSATRAGWSS